MSRILKFPRTGQGSRRVVAALACRENYRAFYGLQSARRRMPGGWFLWSLVLGALLFSQTLGLMHGLVHQEHARDGQEIERLHPQGDEASGPHSNGWLEKLFASHEEEGSQCRVFDHQNHSALILSVAALALPSVLRGFTAAVWASCPPSASAASFDARGPPLPH